MDQGGQQIPHSRKSISELMSRVLNDRESRPPPPLSAPNAVEGLLAARSSAQAASARERSLVEVNVQRLPFAILTSKKSGSKTPIVVEESFHRGGEVETRSWRASPNTEYGLPGPSAYLVFRALERLVLGRTLGRGAPLENPQSFEFQDISRLLGMALHSDNRDQIRLDLKRIKGTTFVNRGMLRKRMGPRKHGRPSRARRTVHEEAVSLIERVVFRSEELPDGSVATQNQVWFGSFYLDSVNSGYVKPFDWDLWQSFRRPATRRLFEIMDLRMNATPEAEILDFDYDKLVALVPLTPQRFLSLARAVVDPLLNELRGPVLESYTWREIDGAWMLHLSPSPSYRRRRADQGSPELDLRAHELAQKLGDMGNLPYYKRVAGKVDRQWIDIALSETKQAEQAGQVRNRGAYFTKVLREILTRRGLPVPFGA
jgi:hypothetical protein